MENHEIEIVSRTQSAETIQKILAEDGYGDTEAQTLTDSPEPLASEKPAKETAGEPAAGESEEGKAAAEQPVAETVAQPVAEEHARKSGSARLKEKLTRVETENERLKRELEEAKAAHPATTPETEAKPAEAKPKPKPDDFELGQYDPEFVEALADWKYDERKRKDAETETAAKRASSDRQQQDRLQAHKQADEDAWKAQIAEARELRSDFDETVAKGNMALQEAGFNQLPPALFLAMHDSDRGGDVAWWLGAHPEELVRICQAVQLDSGSSERALRRAKVAADREIARIEEALEETPAAPAAPAQPPTTATPAPAAPPAGAAPKITPKPTPVIPVGNRGAARRTLDDYTPEELRNLSNEEYRKATGRE